MLAPFRRPIERRARYLESQADAVARDRALVPILDFARDCFQIVRDGFRAFAGVCPPLFSITVDVPNSTDQDHEGRNSLC